jgi:hypothetical protein
MSHPDFKGVFTSPSPSGFTNENVTTFVVKGTGSGTCNIAWSGIPSKDTLASVEWKSIRYFHSDFTPMIIQMVLKVGGIELGKMRGIILSNGTSFKGLVGAKLGSKRTADLMKIDGLWGIPIEDGSKRIQSYSLYDSPSADRICPFHFQKCFSGSSCQICQTSSEPIAAALYNVDVGKSPPSIQRKRSRTAELDTDQKDMKRFREMKEQGHTLMEIRRCLTVTASMEDEFNNPSASSDSSASPSPSAFSDPSASSASLASSDPSASLASSDPSVSSDSSASPISLHNNKWKEMRARLETYRDTHNGSCNVPYRYPEDSKLGRWVWTQRSELRKYMEDPETSTLSAERISALEQMGAIKSWIKFSESSAPASSSASSAPASASSAPASASSAPASASSAPASASSAPASASSAPAPASASSAPASASSAPAYSPEMICLNDSDTESEVYWV